MTIKTLGSTSALTLKLKNLNQAFGERGRAINMGDCYVWAYCAYKLVGGNFCEIGLSTGEHVFLEIESKFYDAEDLRGVDNWRSLQYARRSRLKSPMKYLTLARFKADWMHAYDEQLVRSILTKVKA